jgi:sporulation protein YlmC with PRC-barrel domain
MAAHEPAYSETTALIASNEVEGTSVYSSAGEKIGNILNVMINKHSGYVSYAVMTFGGFLGLGADHYPIPWKKLKYSLEHHGFVADIDLAKLAAAPQHSADNPPIYNPAYDALVGGFYGVII